MRARERSLLAPSASSPGSPLAAAAPVCTVCTLSRTTACFLCSDGTRLTCAGFFGCCCLCRAHPPACRGASCSLCGINSSRFPHSCPPTRCALPPRKPSSPPSLGVLSVRAAVLWNFLRSVRQSSVSACGIFSSVWTPRRCPSRAVCVWYLHLFGYLGAGAQLPGISDVSVCSLLCARRLAFGAQLSVYVVVAFACKSSAKLRSLAWCSRTVPLGPPTVRALRQRCLWPLTLSPSLRAAAAARARALSLLPHTPLRLESCTGWPAGRERMHPPPASVWQALMQHQPVHDSRRTGVSGREGREGLPNALAGGGRMRSCAAPTSA